MKTQFVEQIRVGRIEDWIPRFVSAFLRRTLERLVAWQKGILVVAPASWRSQSSWWLTRGGLRPVIPCANCFSPLLQPLRRHRYQPLCSSLSSSFSFFVSFELVFVPWPALPPRVPDRWAPNWRFLAFSPLPSVNDTTKRHLTISYFACAPNETRNAHKTQEIFCSQDLPRSFSSASPRRRWKKSAMFALLPSPSPKFWTTVRTSKFPSRSAPLPGQCQWSLRAFLFDWNNVGK